MSLNRISRHSMFMEIAHVVAKRSTCMRLNVGAALVHDNSIVSIGYNGAPSGEAHCSGSACPGWSTGCHRSIHAEMNALDRAPASLWGMALYVTHSPCVNCWTHLWESRRIDRIFFSTPFRDTSHMEDTLFEMEVYRILPAGGIIDWSTGGLVSEA